jgi:hypothetical protein
MVESKEQQVNMTAIQGLSRSSNSQQARSKASQLSQVIQMQERFSKIDKSNYAALNTSSNEVESVGKKSSNYAQKALF